MKSGVPIEQILEEWGDVEQALPENHPFGLRMRRATSWIKRAESEEDDPDSAFIFCWIAFNAAYADERIEGEWILFDDYFHKILELEAGRAIHRAVWQRFPNPIKEFVGNRFVYWRFWDFQRGVPGAEDWEAKLAEDEATVNAALRTQRTSETRRVLKILFDRLYVLRNQLLHGGATWDSSL